MDITARERKIKKAEARLHAANLRVIAAHQRDDAQRYYRQASHPAYEGQIERCIGKGKKAEAIAAENEAKADLIEAQTDTADL